MYIHWGECTFILYLRIKHIHIKIFSDVLASWIFIRFDLRHFRWKTIFSVSSAEIHIHYKCLPYNQRERKPNPSERHQCCPSTPHDCEKHHLFSGRSSVNELTWHTAHKTPREAQRHMYCVTVTAQSLIVSSFKFGSSTFGFLMKFRTSQVTAVKSAQCYFRRSRTQTWKT